MEWRSESPHNLKNIIFQVKNVQVQYAHYCCLFHIFDQITMAEEQKYLRYTVFE